MPDSSITRYHFKPDLPLGFELIDLASLYEHQGDKLTVPHRTSFFHILWFSERNVELTVDFKAVRVNANALLFLKKGVVQQFGKVKTKGKVLLFTEDFVARHSEAATFLKSSILFNDLLETAQFQLPPNDPAIPLLFEAMESECSQAPDVFQADILLNNLHNLLLTSERMYRKSGFREITKSADLDYTLLFRDRLESGYSSMRQVSRYAALLHVTEKRLNAATRNILGRSPKEIIDERVMLEAKRLLAHTWRSVKEVGYALGFEEPTNFIKYFRKHAGKTPVAFREEIVR